MRECKHRATQLLHALVVSVLFGLGATGCGAAVGNSAGLSSSTSSGTAAAEAQPITTRAIPPGQHVRGDGDADNPSDIDGNGDSDSALVGGADNDSDSPTRESYRFPDRDDRTVFAYGHPPSIAAGRAISSIVKRYYAAVSSGDGDAACSLLQPSLARSVPESYAGPLGPPYLRGAGKTCQAVLAKLFQHYHDELATPIEVVEVRVKGPSAQAILSSRTMRASSVFLARQGNSWEIVGVLAQPLG